MKRDDIRWLKEFAAAERGVSPDKIGDDTVTSRYRRRWTAFFFGLMLVLCAYFVFRFLLNPAFGKGFVIFMVLTSLGSSLLRFQSSGRLTAGPLLLTKRQLAEKLQVGVDHVSDAAVQDFDRLNARAILRGLLVVAVASFLSGWFWPNVALEILTLIIFYCTGILAWRTIPRKVHGQI